MKIAFKRVNFYVFVRHYFFHNHFLIPTYFSCFKHLLQDLEMELVAVLKLLAHLDFQQRSNRSDRSQVHCNLVAFTSWIVLWSVLSSLLLWFHQCTFHLDFILLDSLLIRQGDVWSHIHSDYLEQYRWFRKFICRLNDVSCRYWVLNMHHQPISSLHRGPIWWRHCLPSSLLLF